MSKLFPNYQPSTALRQAIAKYREALSAQGKDGRVAADAAAPGQLGGTFGGPGQTDADDRNETGKAPPGREGTGAGAWDLGGKSDADALTSGRKPHD